MNGEECLFPVIKMYILQPSISRGSCYYRSQTGRLLLYNPKQESLFFSILAIDHPFTKFRVKLSCKYCVDFVTKFRKLRWFPFFGVIYRLCVFLLYVRVCMYWVQVCETGVFVFFIVWQSILVPSKTLICMSNIELGIRVMALICGVHAIKYECIECISECLEYLSPGVHWWPGSINEVLLYGQPYIKTGSF